MARGGMGARPAPHLPHRLIGHLRAAAGGSKVLNSEPVTIDIYTNMTVQQSLSNRLKSHILAIEGGHCYQWPESLPPTPKNVAKTLKENPQMTILNGMTAGAALAAIRSTYKQS